MKTSDEIFQLIKSLSKQEKSYFKKFASAFAEKESSNYIKLYDEITAQTKKGNPYDEEEIKKGIYSGKFIKNLSYHKNYLYNMILSSLTLYQKDSDDSIAIRNLISQSKILFGKLLYNQSLKLILRAKKLAGDTDRFIYLLEIINHESQVYKYILNGEELEAKNKSLYKEKYHCLDILKNNIDYSYLNDYFGNFSMKSGTGRVRNKKEISKLDEFFKNPLLSDINNAKTYQNKTIFNTLHLQYCNINYDYESGHKYILNNIELFENNLKKSRNNFDNYLHALNNLLSSLLQNKKYEEFDLTIRKMNNLDKTHSGYLTELNKVFIFYSTSVYQISKCFNLLDENNFNMVLKNIDDNIKNYENKIRLYQRIILYYFLGLSYFVLRNYEKSIHWMGKIINIEKTDRSQDYQCYSRIVYLICYYELGYYDSLEYAMKSAYHFLSKRERVYQYENIILKYLRRSFRIKTNEELNLMFVEMNNELKNILNDPFEQNAFDAFNILTWLKSKIGNDSIFNILRMEKELEINKS